MVGCITWLWVALVGTALAYASIGVYQWATRDVFWNPKVIVGNAYAPFFRVNSIFWDPSIYGRYLTVGILTALAGILLGGVRGWKLAGLYAVVVAMWVGLFFSFSQSSFVALAVGVLVAALVVWGRAAVVRRRRARRRARGRIDRRAAGASPRRDEVALGGQLGHERPRDARGAGAADRGRAIRSAASAPAGSGERMPIAPGFPGKRPKKAASHTTPVTVAAEEGLPGLVLFGWLCVAALLAALRGLGRGFTSRVSFAVGLTLVAIIVHSFFYNALFEDPMTWAHARPRRARGQRATQGDDVIEGCRRALVLAPHTDDGEFGCGGTTARLVEAGCEVRYVAFSIATRSLPPGFPPDTLAREVREATAELGIPESHLTVHDFDVRTFPDRRQDILELLVALWEEWRPDVVFQPSHHDVHQDHQTIAQEGLRAFKRTTILGYEIPWNNFDFSYGAYVALEQRHLERKIAAVEKYASQQHRRYANAEYIWNLARVHGTNVNRELAEVFQVYRIVA